MPYERLGSFVLSVRRWSRAAAGAAVLSVSGGGSPTGGREARPAEAQRPSDQAMTARRGTGSPGMTGAGRGHERRRAQGQTAT